MTFARGVALHVLVLCAGLLLLPATAGSEPLRIGSKRFTESYILGEVLQGVAATGGPATHKPGLGNTGILYAALRAGSIDLYPEYSGTIAQEILRLPGDSSLESIRAALSPLGLAVSVPLGFNDGYALGVSSSVAERLGLKRISDLGTQPSLRFGLSHEFLGRPAGWEGLVKAYGFEHQLPVALDHGLAGSTCGSMFIETETTPNPATLKFLPGELVMTSGTRSFTSPEEAEVSPLASALFSLGDVTEVLFGREFVSVTIAPGAEWASAKPQVLAILLDHFVSQARSEEHTSELQSQ